MKSSKANLGRLLPALRYSWSGFKAAYKTEAAFRQEVFLGAVLLVIALALPVTVYERAALIASLLIVIIVELLNTGIEAAIDRVSDEMHPISAYAKDVASAAVFSSLLLCTLVWASVLWVLFKRL